MKMSLCDMFDVDHPIMFENFASKPVHTAYTWAIARLQERIINILTEEDAYAPEKVELRKYLDDAIKHYQGNLDEFYLKKNTSLREEKSEPNLIDIISTVA